MKKSLMATGILLLALGVGGCGLFKAKEETVPVSSAPSKAIVSEIIGTDGEALGNAVLTETEEGVNIQLKLEGLEPGKKAIHIHETAKCVPPDFKAAGSHFNPYGKEHGFDNPKGFHAGDLPNLEVDSEGKVDLELTSPEVTLKEGEPASLLDKDGSALVIHQGEDDYKTDPAGNSGDRIACGEISK